ncbi:MAG: Eco57I restriction-modification methylase domain-containing protein [Ktedonobacteraceae bacterium]|nr:Eco57I restriction-modification methylase domain-containing protein [Ktedonobacteraceae bacterium]
MKEHTHTTIEVEQVMRQFHHHFKAERVIFLSSIEGIDSTAEREQYGALLLNRLMFLYFLQQRGLLDGDCHYLSNRLRQVRLCQGENAFYRQFLLHLFYEVASSAACTAEQCNLSSNTLRLTNGLFTPSPLERTSPALQITDEAFTRLFAFFDSYCWCLDRHPPRHMREITPAILGYIFEQHINQYQMGAYYTKEDVTGYIARNTIIPALFDALARLDPTAFAAHSPLWQRLRSAPDRYIYDVISNPDRQASETEREYQERRAYYKQLHAKLLIGDIHSINDFVTYNLDISRFASDIIRTIAEPELLLALYASLKRLSILDPTCGSGAFLLAALDVLEPLYTAILDHLQTISQETELPGDLQAELAQVRATGSYSIIKTIITHNLYGVDLMPQAAEICKLRLLLRLLACVERIENIEPLPHLEHTIRVGNALVGFVHSPGTLSVADVPALDRALARQYDVAGDDTAVFQRWWTDHRPLHWCAAFRDIIDRGGFDVIIGNPPYVEYSAKTFPYELRGFETLACANLYPCVVERSRQLLAPQGRLGMILPLAAFATRNMIPLIEGFRTWFPQSWLSFYHFRPSMLFSGGKVASIPTVILLASSGESEQRFSTHLLKWATAQRAHLFSRLTYCRITTPRDSQNRHYYPKFGQPLENAIMEKLLLHPPIRRYLAAIPNQNNMYYRSAGGLYWKIFVNFPWPYQVTSNKQCSFQQPYDRDVFVALFNSSLFWWYYTVTFDTFNLKDYVLAGFRFSYPEDPAIVAALQMHCQRLMADFRQHARHLTRGGTGSYTIYARKSKAIIDEIDCVLARHYGLSENELDFIMHYDIKYRMDRHIDNVSSSV